MKRPAQCAFVVLLAGLALAGCAFLGCALVGCASADSNAEPAGAPAAPDWVTAPAASWDERVEPLALQVTGSAVIAGSMAQSEQAAQADALAAIGAFLDGAQAELGVAGTQPARVATALQSARVRGKFHDGRRYFVWMACDAGLVLPDDAPPAARDELARLVARRNRG